MAGRTAAPSRRHRVVEPGDVRPDNHNCPWPVLAVGCRASDRAGPNEREPCMPGGSEQEATCRRLERLERLLACFQKALGHEMPNQLVAIGGLLRLLELEEGERLG